MTLPAQFSRMSLPVIGAPLFIISHPRLVIAQCTSGIVGSMPALNARPKEMLEEWLQRITTQPPDDTEVEVAIKSLNDAMELEQKQGGQLVIA